MASVSPCQSVIKIAFVQQGSSVLMAGVKSMLNVGRIVPAPKARPVWLVAVKRRESAVLTDLVRRTRCAVTGLARLPLNVMPTRIVPR